MAWKAFVRVAAFEKLKVRRSPSPSDEAEMFVMLPPAPPVPNCALPPIAGDEGGGPAGLC